MTRSTIDLDEQLLRYMNDIGVREHPVLAELREYTSTLEEANMQIAPEQGQFMGLLAKIIQPERAIEVGVFTGYSSLALALAMPEQGLITACDNNEYWTSIAKNYWQKAQVEHKIDLNLGAASDLLSELVHNGYDSTYELAFIDADKTNYHDYYEKVLKLLKPGGVVLLDNMFWKGRVADVNYNDDDTRAIRELNQHIYQDERVDIAMMPIGDGVFIARKR